MLYMDIAKSLTKKVLNDEFENNKLPSELDLAKQYSTSKVTIRKSLKILREASLIYSIPKQGYFINTFEDIKKFTSLNGNSLSFLNKDQKIISNIIYFEIIEADNSFKKIFKKDINKLIKIKRIRTINNDVKTLETIYMDYQLFSDFKKKDAEGSIYKYIKDKGFNIATNLKTLTANFAPDIFLQHVPELKGKPLIEIENIGYLTNGEVFEYSKSYNINSSYSTFINYDIILKND